MTGLLVCGRSLIGIEIGKPERCVVCMVVREQRRWDVLSSPQTHDPSSHEHTGWSAMTRNRKKNDASLAAVDVARTAFRIWDNSDEMGVPKRKVMRPISTSQLALGISRMRRRENFLFRRIRRSTTQPLFDTLITYCSSSLSTDFVLA